MGRASAAARGQADLVRRSGDLKRELVDFAQQRRFARAFRQVARGRFGLAAVGEEWEVANLLDAFMLQHRLPDGRTVVEQFVAEHPELPEQEREMLLGWQDVVEGIFQVKRRQGGALVADNLVDGLTYRVRSNMGPAALATVRPGSFLIARLLPVGDQWLLSGVASMLPAGSRVEAGQVAEELLARRPELVFRNPERLARAWELQREERCHFIAFFGSDLVVLPGPEVAEHMRAYAHFLVYGVRDEKGQSAADRARQLHGVVASVPDYGLPAELCEADTVGVVFDQVEGLHFLAGFGLVQEAFTNPELAADRVHRQAVLGYLKEPSIPPLAVRRLAEQGPERASQVLRRVLKRPGFSWERDGEALLRRHKASYFEGPVLPSVTPVAGFLADHFRRAHRPDRGGN